MLAGVGDDSDEEGDEEELAPAARNPKQVVLGGGSKQIEPDMGAKDAACDMGKHGPAESAASREDITRD